MRNPWKVTTLILAMVLAFVVGHSQVRNAAADNQPTMRSALGSLRAALTSLQNATADKGGHRVKAISLTKDAISEVEKGVKFDNKH